MDETIITTIDSIKDTGKREPYLLIIGGKQLGKLYHLDKDELIAGRSPDCTIWIEDNAISRKHFRVTRAGDKWTVDDLNSTNGTFINNRRVKSAVLAAGDKIQISTETIIQFNYLDENQQVSEQQRYDMGTKDAVTGAYNKMYFTQRIGDEFSFSQRQNQPLSVVMVDIDHFKLINDTYGHLAGDQVLQQVSRLIQDMIREEDVFCRYGGEEFVIIMRNTPCQAAVNLAERVRRKIEASHFESMDNQTIKVTISLGVSTNVENKFHNYVALIGDADKYLYQAKGSGRNRVMAACKPEIQ